MYIEPTLNESMYKLGLICRRVLAKGRNIDRLVEAEAQRPQRDSSWTLHIEPTETTSEKAVFPLMYARHEPNAMQRLLYVTIQPDT